MVVVLHLVVVAAARIQAYDEGHVADALGEELHVEGQVWRAALLSRLQPHQSEQTLHTP